MTRTVLLVDYFFPPLGGPGVQRTLGYARYLPRSRWLPVVLTVAGGDHNFVDESLCDRVPADVDVIRAWSIEPLRFARRSLATSSASRRSPAEAAGEPFWHGSRRLRNLEYWLLFPDRHIGWLPFAVARGLALGRRRPIDVVYSSSTSVMTGHLVGYLLKRFLRRPWVADLQDAWLESYVSYFPSIVHREAAERLERFVVTRADRITVATEPHADLLRSRYGPAVAEKVVVVPMGYDPEAFAGVTAGATSKFVITHFGSFYSSRSPAAFLTAVAAAVARDAELAHDLEVDFLGTFDAATLEVAQRVIAQHRMESIVHRRGVLPYTSALTHLAASNVLLLITDQGVWGRKLFASKLMEYLAAGRTILALVPPGVTADVVRQTRAGLVIPPDDIPAIRDAILSLYAAWKEGTLIFRGDDDLIRQLAWPQVCTRFAVVLEESLTRTGGVIA